MSMTSRISGTSRLERAAAFRMISSGRNLNLRQGAGISAGELVGITRIHRFVQGVLRLCRKFMGLRLAAQRWVHSRGRKNRRCGGSLARRTQAVGLLQQMVPVSYTHLRAHET